MCMKPAPDRAGYAANTKRKRRQSRPDGRTTVVRRLKSLIEAYSLGLGDLTPVDQTLVRTAAVVALRLEMLEADLASGKPVDSDELIRLASTSRRALAAVSAKAIDRKPGTQTLQEYLAAKHAATLQPDGDDEGE
jgi:hypothetical protein